jgi:hypothetical protein
LLNIPWQLGSQRIFPNTHDTDVCDFGMAEKDAFELSRRDLELRGSRHKIEDQVVAQDELTPFTLMSSFFLSTILYTPWESTMQTSPVLYQPSGVNAFLVASGFPR